MVQIIFAALLLFNGWGVSLGWKNLNLPGCEFRQAQTAVSALFIQRDNDFSLAYPTPVLGKPWSVPMEFPLYQWTVVVVSNVTGISLTSAARTVSAACFYLALPAFYLLLRRMGLNGNQRLLTLGFILTCPLYIFYARSFMIETMALMSGAWYLIALIEARGKRSARWLALCMIAGTAAGLVKVTTFIVFLLPAFGWTLIEIWKTRPRVRSASWRPLLNTLRWFALAHVIPFVATYAWIKYSDHIKLQNPSGAALTSSNLAGWNFGIGQRFSPAVWAAHWHIFFQELLSPAVGVLCVVAGLFVRRRQFFISLSLLALFFAVQLIFPVLYARHEYYYVAIGFALMAAIAVVMQGLWQMPKIPQFAAVALLVFAYGAQIRLWYQNHFEEQRFQGGGLSLVSLIDFVTNPDETIMVAGDDWNSMTPYYTQRKALMLRDDVIRSPENFDLALEKMRDAQVAVLVVRGQWMAGDGDIVDKISQRLDIDERPALFSEWEKIYFNRAMRSEALAALEARGINRFVGFKLSPEAKYRDRPLANQVLHYAKLSDRHKKLFHLFQPRPESSFSAVEPQLWNLNGTERFFAHPETKLWYPLLPGNYRFQTTIEMTASSYTDVPKADATDGVLLIASLVQRDGKREELRRQYINPRDNPADRGVLPIDWSFSMPGEAQLEIAVTAGPAGNAARDWVTLGLTTIDLQPSGR